MVGDLEPAVSGHHLTTLKRAYLKLRHLVDAGCIFVGHGLKKDFRMINIVVPPAQARPDLSQVPACTPHCQDAWKYILLQAGNLMHMYARLGHSEHSSDL